LKRERATKLSDFLPGEGPGKKFFLSFSFPRQTNASFSAAAMSVYEKTFTLKDEDHTIGNAVRYMLNKNPQVSLAGYSVPHPMETSVNVRVQTTGEVTATAAMRDALLDIVSVCDHVHDTFDAAVEDFKAKNPAPMDVAQGKKKK
jgi:DNA-directed RNA polymerase I and III subunit RPAC2